MNFDLRNVQGELLEHDFHPGEPSDNRIMVLGHGVTANKDRPFLVALAQGLSSTGMNVLRFSFSGNGKSEGRFEESTITKELDDLGAVLGSLETYRVGYVGHSMGAAVGTLRAAADDRIRVMVSLAGMVHTKAFYERKFAGLEPGKDFMWDKPECPISQAFIDDMKTIDSVLESAKQVTVPWLLVHGDDDSVVPIQDSKDIQRACPERPELITLSGADHVFTRPHDATMVEAVVPWIMAQTFA